MGGVCFMKRKVAIALFVCLVAFIFPSLAENLNIGEMTTDELIELKGAIDSELSQRGVSERSGYLLSRGYYFVGTDIEPGSYVFYVEGDNSSQVSVFTKDGYDGIAEGKREMEEAGEDPGIRRDVVFVPESEVVEDIYLYEDLPEVRVTLEEGMAINISNQCYITNSGPIQIP
jgi:hypothetical protein